MVQAKANLNNCCNTNIDNVFRTKSQFPCLVLGNIHVHAF